MKSSTEQLQNRGFVPDGGEDEYADIGENGILDLLHSKEAYKRTTGIRLVSRNKKKKYLPLLCELLTKEKKLYTTIALCNCLAGYGEAAVPYLLPLLGSIGNNQHRKIEAVDLGKKSYPLPRDIAGRILIRIGPTIFPGLKKILTESRNPEQICEAIEAVGHISWNYHDNSMEDTLINIYRKNKHDDFRKIIRAFQSFNSSRVRNILEDTAENHCNKVIVQEAKRSLDRIHTRNKN